MANTHKSPPGETDSDAAGSLSLRCYQKLRWLEKAYHERVAEALDGFELDIFDSMLLLECCANSTDSNGQNWLSSALSVSPAKISLRLESLRQRGVVEPIRNTADRRRQSWRVSKYGLKLAGQLELRLNQLFPESVRVSLNSQIALAARLFSRQDEFPVNDTKTDSRAA